MRHLKFLSIGLMTTMMACSGAEESVAFKGDVVNKVTQNAEPENVESVPSADQIPVAETPAPEAPVPEDEPTILQVEQQILVELSENNVRSGAKNVQAKAILAVPSESKIIWSVEGDASLDLGQIDENGKYTSPAKAAEAFTISIVATLASDPNIVGKKPLQVIPAELLFMGCKKGNQSFPISADVFTLPVNTKKLPDFSTMTKSDVVCFDKFDIAPQSWTTGFVNATSLNEWFGLHAKAKIIIPASGLYEFRALTDDGSILYIDGDVVINHDGLHSPSSKDGSVELSLGKHDFVLDYYQGPRPDVALQLFWKVPGSSKFVIVPASAFSEN